MISICCCAINSKFEVETFIENLFSVNFNFDFEVCLTLDNRVEDGSIEYIARLKQKYRNLKTIVHTHDDTVIYLKKLIKYYKDNNKFDSKFINLIEERTHLFEHKNLFDTSKSFLWLSSGILYNKAVSISSGKTLIITPADFLYFFRLSDIKSFVDNNSCNGDFYAKPNAIFSRVSNQPIDWLLDHVCQVHKGINHRANYRYDSEEVFIDYLRYPVIKNPLYLADFRNNKIYPITDIDNIYNYNIQSTRLGGLETIKQFHGFHVINRQTFDKIGGFSEAFYGRAYADDTMTYKGNKYSPRTMPDNLAVAWVRSGEIAIAKGIPYKQGYMDILSQVDPFHATHPLPPSAPTYLHGNSISNMDLSYIVSKELPKETVVRL